MPLVEGQRTITFSFPLLFSLFLLHMKDLIHSDNYRVYLCNCLIGCDGELKEINRFFFVKICIYFWNSNRRFCSGTIWIYKGNQRISINMLNQVTTCIKHLANNPLPCSPLFRIWRGDSPSYIPYSCAVLHSRIKFSKMSLIKILLPEEIKVEKRQWPRTVIAASWKEPWNRHAKQMDRELVSKW